MAYSAPVKVKLRYHNYIHEMVLPLYVFKDLRTLSASSSVVKGLDPRDATSTVIGNFQYPLEIMSAQCQGQEIDQATAMEFEVSKFYLLMLILKITVMIGNYF